MSVELIRIVTAAAVALFLIPLAHAQKYPQWPIRMIVPFAPGGGTDIVARAVAQKMGDAMGAQIVVDNRPGANANIGNEIVAKAAPDGYTIIMTSSAVTINPGLFKKLSYDPIKDFAPISLATYVPYVLVCHPSLPVTSFPEFINYAREKQGQLSYGSAGQGNATHLSMELLKIVVRIDMTHIPYKGTGPALTDLLGNQVQAIWGTIPAAWPHVKSGRLKALATGGSKRTKAISEVPTVAELGYPGFEAASWFGLLAPAGTPSAVVLLLNREATKALNSPDLNERLSAEGAEPAGNTPAQFAAFIKSEIAKWEKVAKAAGIQRQ